MTELTPITFVETDIDRIAAQPGRIAVFAAPGGRLDVGARRVNKLMRGALKRMLEGEAFGKSKPGAVTTMAWPTGLAAEAVDVVHLARGSKQEPARRAGGGTGQAARQGGSAGAGGRPAPGGRDRVRAGDAGLPV